MSMRLHDHRTDRPDELGALGLYVAALGAAVLIVACLFLLLL